MFVLVLSNVTKFETNSDDIKQGDNITLSCTVTKGVPSPKIEILKDTTVINTSLGSDTEERTLRHPISSISRQASGKYFCRVTTMGTRAKNVSMLDVTVKCKYILAIIHNMLSPKNQQLDQADEKN